MPEVKAVNFQINFQQPSHQTTLCTEHYEYLRRLNGTFTKFQALPPTLMMNLLTVAKHNAAFLRQKLCLFFRRSFRKRQKILLTLPSVHQIYRIDVKNNTYIMHNIDLHYCLPEYYSDFTTTECIIIRASL